MVKISYVLDTNILLSNARAIYGFSDGNVVIPLVVLQEIDSKKCGFTELAANARMVNRMLSDLGDLNKGVTLENGSMLRVICEADTSVLPSFLPVCPDNMIIATAVTLSKKTKVVMVSNDLNLRTKASALGLTTQGFDADKVDEDEVYTGTATFEVEGSVITEFDSGGELPLGEYGLMPHEMVVLKDKEDDTKFTYGRYDARNSVLKPVEFKGSVWGIYPRSLEQTLCLDLLMDTDVKLLSIVGAAGGGKTLLALSAALTLVGDMHKYQKVMVVRNVVSMGEEIGFLPGSAEEKLAPWMGSIADSLEVILANSTKGKGKNAKQVTMEDLQEQGILDCQPLSYLRGRSLNNVICIVEEAQNISKHEIKSIITRMGRNSKCILTGDPSQIDKMNLDKYNNGLSYVVEKFKDSHLAGHIELIECERSALAKEAAERL